MTLLVNKIEIECKCALGRQISQVCVCLHLYTFKQICVLISRQEKKYLRNDCIHKLQWEKPDCELTKGIIHCTLHPHTD